MTCLDKLKEMHPDWDEDSINVALSMDCPDDFGIMDAPDWCGPATKAHDCPKCWAREIPEDSPKDIPVTTEPHIKDSGDRTQFESGAVRDMREGKGRFDLVPLEVVAQYILEQVGDDEDNKWDILDYHFIDNLACFKKTSKTSYLYSALHVFAAKAFKSEPDMFLEVAKHYEEGAKKYGPDNWVKGIPTYCYLDSTIRHWFKWKDDWNDEPHSKAIIWNVLCCIWEVDYGEEWRKN